jgi:hypothetical protein
VAPVSTSVGLHPEPPAIDTPPAILSSASSITNAELPDKILAGDSRSDINEPDGSGVISPAEGGFSKDEEAQRQLRDHLRRTLTNQALSKGAQSI